MNTHNMCFHGEIRKKFIWMPFFSRAKIDTSVKHKGCHQMEQGQGLIRAFIIFACFARVPFYTPPHNSGRVLWFHVGRPSVVRPSVFHFRMIT